MSQDVLSALEALGVPYEVLPCDPAAADTAAFCERYGFPRCTVGNTIVVVAKEAPPHFAACVIPAERQLDVNHKVRSVLGGARASFASPEDTKRVTGMELGAVSPFGLPKGVPLFVDELLLSIQGLILGAGDRLSKIRVGGAVLASIPGAKVVSDLSRTRS